MNEIECARCGWNLPEHDAEIPLDCPFCPTEIGGVTYSSDHGVPLVSPAKTAGNPPAYP
jgi:hypothetical protein